jgi:hypothetical protein
MECNGDAHPIRETKCQLENFLFASALSFAQGNAPSLYCWALSILSHFDEKNEKS